MALRVLVAALLLVCASARAQDEVRPRSAALLEQGNAAFARAMDAPEGTPANERALREAMAAYRTVLDGGLDGPALRLNLAAIDAQLARRGSAALHLRAAGRMALESGDDDAHRAANAAFRAVRPGAGEAWPPDIMPAPSRLALDAAHAAGVGTLLAAFAACWSLGWLTLAMRIGRFGPRMPWLIPATLLLAGALSGGVLGAASFADVRAGSLGVIVTDRATLRAGPGDAFDAVATAAGEGADVRVVREQRGWLRIETAGGAEGWIPRDAVAFVTQP